MIRKFLLVGFSVFFLGVNSVDARDFKKFEVFGGYSLMKGDFEFDQSGTDGIRQNGIILSPDDPIASGIQSLINPIFRKEMLHGFNVSVTYNINKHFGIEASISRLSVYSAPTWTSPTTSGQRKS
jgi:hypothetical protein